MKKITLRNENITLPKENITLPSEKKKCRMITALSGRKKTLLNQNAILPNDNFAFKTNVYKYGFFNNWLSIFFKIHT